MSKENQKELKIPQNNTGHYLNFNMSHPHKQINQIKYLNLHIYKVCHVCVKLDKSTVYRIIYVYISIRGNLFSR